MGVGVVEKLGAGLLFRAVVVVTAVLVLLSLLLLLLAERFLCFAPSRLAAGRFAVQAFVGHTPVVRPFTTHPVPALYKEHET